MVALHGVPTGQLFTDSPFFGEYETTFACWSGLVAAARYEDARLRPMRWATAIEVSMAGSTTFRTLRNTSLVGLLRTIESLDGCDQNYEIVGVPSSEAWLSDAAILLIDATLGVASKVFAPIIKGDCK